jgi:molecular chaperone GrpE (heat shock protein)
MEKQNLFSHILEKIKDSPKHQAILHNNGVLLIALPHRLFFNGYLVRRSKYFKKVLKEIRRQLQHQSDNIAQQWCQLQEYGKAVECCRQETAKILNHELERHALNPAIETVVQLYDEIISLKNLAGRLKHEAKDCPSIVPFLRSLQISADIAEDKLAYLGIERLTPAEGDELDPLKHNACHAVQTNSKELHGKVSQLLSPGLIYRSKVLRQARVSVFRYSNDKNIETQKGE